MEWKGWKDTVDDQGRVAVPCVIEVEVAVWVKPGEDVKDVVDLYRSEIELPAEKDYPDVQVLSIQTDVGEWIGNTGRFRVPAQEGVAA